LSPAAEPAGAGLFETAPGYLRVVSFVSIAWLVARLSRLWWTDRLAAALPPVVMVDRQGLTCFVRGTLILIVADTALQVAAPRLHARKRLPRGYWPTC
jgi:hypothetical protein